ncbi:DNA-binding transcriptional regulator [Luteimicrobium album]|uniref:DNA-binding transcriptional regulator n=1 Tax=Luteimicrobium album TaxID=1054550 RepID=A0ABQ6I4J3_9MICO|nr:transcriptional regulator [Luteimicrobium album]GMA25542.1 DNA-binding transcriptional regulator [Luteimicrobium album]
MQETSARLLELLSLLQARREWTGRELAARLEVGERTVRRDVERLRALGYPVAATRGVAGGYRLEAGAAMPPLLLSDDEAVAIAVGLRTAARHPVRGIDESAARAIVKLEQVLPPRLRARVVALAGATVDVPPDAPAPLVDADTIAAFAGAVRDHETVRFDYTRHDGTGSRRRTEPHRLVVWERRWYLLAWDLDRADWRTFRLDRCGLPTPPRGPRFVPRELPDEPADLVRRGVSAAGAQVRARVVVHAPVAAVLSRVSPAVGTVTARDDDTCLLDAGAESPAVLARYLAWLDADFEVLGPPEVQAEVRALAARYARADAGPDGGS